jgi:hypothetical protein
MRSLVLLVALLLCAASAASSGEARPPCTARSACQLTGPLRYDPARNVIELLLAEDACVVQTTVKGFDGREHARRDSCAPYPNKDWSAVHLRTPWGEELPGFMVTPGRLGFPLDFTRSGLDALAPDVDAALGKEWCIVGGPRPRCWTPTPEERPALHATLAVQTDTQIDVADVTAPPGLTAETLLVVGELRNGGAARLRLTVKNGGQGAAYLVSVTTRSNVTALHGLRFSFGKLEPGQSKVREVAVALPTDNDEMQAVVVLAFDEAHQFVPEPVTRRFAVLPAVSTPRLRIACQLMGGTGDRPHVDAGQILHVQCTVRNEGARARDVRVWADLAGRPANSSPAPFDLDTSRFQALSFTLVVPREATLDSELALTVRVRHADSKAVESEVITLVIARPAICPDGKLTRAQFETKRAELKRTLAEGIITQEEYDRYEEQLVGCLP